MKYIAETEKAVRLSILIDFVHLEVVKSFEVWVPKSQLAENGVPGQWITAQKFNELSTQGGALFVAWMDADGVRYDAGYTDRENESESRRSAAFESGKKSYEELIEKARSLGIKGVRSGMRRATIEEKISKVKGER